MTTTTETITAEQIQKLRIEAAAECADVIATAEGMDDAPKTAACGCTSDGEGADAECDGTGCDSTQVGAVSVCSSCGCPKEPLPWNADDADNQG